MTPNTKKRTDLFKGGIFENIAIKHNIDFFCVTMGIVCYAWGDRYSRVSLLTDNKRYLLADG